MKRFRSSGNLAALTVQCLNCPLNTIPFHLKGPSVHLSEAMGPADLLGLAHSHTPGLRHWPHFLAGAFLCRLPGSCHWKDTVTCCCYIRQSGEPLAALTDKETVMHGVNETHGGHGFPISCLEGPVPTTQMCQGVTPFSTNTKQRYEIRRSHQRNPLPFSLVVCLKLWQFLMISNDHKQPSVFCFCKAQSSSIITRL